MDWFNKVALITGSSRGIGRATALALAQLGVSVMLNGRSARKLEETRAELSAKGYSVQAWIGDVSKPNEAKQLLQKTLETFGRLDFLINNAGLSMRGSFEDLVPETVENLVSTNFQGSVYPTLHALEALKTSQGSVVFISSLAGVRGFPGVSIYSSSKMALTALSQSLRVEMKPYRVHVGLLYLGFTENDPDKVILTAQGEPVQHSRHHQMTQEQAAQAIVKMISRRKKTRVMTFSGKVLHFFQRHCPRLTDFLIGRSRGKIHQSRILKEGYEKK